MASDKSDIQQVKPEELIDPSSGGLAGAPAVHIDDVEEVKKPSEGQGIESQEEEEELSPPAMEELEPIVHETPNVKTTVTEGEPKLSTKSKMMGKLEQLGDKLRPKDAVEAKNADPHPGLV